MSESDGRLACSVVVSAAHVGSFMLPSGAMVQRDGASVHAVKTVLVVFIFVYDDAVSSAPSARGVVHVVHVCLVRRESLALCQIHCS